MEKKMNNGNEAGQVEPLVMCDFTAYAHPVLAVSCPDCKAIRGVWCKRPSEHKAAEFHQSRGMLADRIFIKQHGSKACIDKIENAWVINPSGYQSSDISNQLSMFSNT